MKNKRFTRIMSLAMAMCMVFAIVPTASANTVGEDVVYEFAGSGIGYTANSTYVGGTANNVFYEDSLETIQADITEAGLPWNIDSYYIEASAANGNNFGITKTALSLVASNKKSAWYMLKLDVAQAGYYNLSTSITSTDIRNANVSADIEIYDTDKETLLTSKNLKDVVTIGTAYSGDDVDFGCQYLDKGSFYVKVIADNNSYAGSTFVYMQSFTLTPLNGDVFAEKFAVIEKNNTDNYDIHFFGGLKSIDYKAVGFEVTVGGVAKSDITTTNVYEQIKVSVDGSATDITAADFGTGSKYIYYATLEDVAAGSEIVITPYVLDGDNNKIYYGKTFTYTVTTAA